MVATCPHSRQGGNKDAHGSHTGTSQRKGFYLRTTKGALSIGREKLRMTMAGCLVHGETPLAKTGKGEWKGRI